MQTTTQVSMEQLVHNSDAFRVLLGMVYDRATFEYDDEVKQRCTWVDGLSGYYGQGVSKLQALGELVHGYLDTYEGI